MIEKSLVNEDDYNGDEIRVKGLFGESVVLKIAKAKIKSPRFNTEILAEFAVCEGKLPFAVNALIGNDFF